MTMTTWSRDILGPGWLEDCCYANWCFCCAAQQIADSVGDRTVLFHVMFRNFPIAAISSLVNGLSRSFLVYCTWDDNSCKKTSEGYVLDFGNFEVLFRPYNLQYWDLRDLEVRPPLALTTLERHLLVKQSVPHLSPILLIASPIGLYCLS